MDVNTKSVTFHFEKMLGHVLDKVTSWLITTIQMIPNLVVAAIILVIFWIVGVMAARLTKHGVLRVSSHVHMAKLFSRLARLAILAVGIILALDILNLEKGVASMLAGIGIIGIGIGFASKDIAANFMSGIMLTFSRPFKTDDLIHTGDFRGYVEAINMRSTVCRSLTGETVIIPNEKILNNPIINFTKTGSRRVDLRCGVSYGNDLQKAEDLAIQAVEALELRIPQRPVELFYEEFGSSSINFILRFWTKSDQKTYLKARSQAIKAIKQAFNENNITIPFPIRTLDFGIVGGVTLSESLQALKLGDSSLVEEDT
ncbi:MAG: mechanosensitive ion channel [Deltaproteobacteria bacterium]|jgi:small conductance mechanosensitive channel